MNLFVASTLLSLAVSTLAAFHTVRASDTGLEANEIADTFARPIERGKPRYPKSAHKKGQEGWVDISYVVQPDGTVIDAIVDGSSGISVFEKSALSAVMKWKFEPATRNGKPVEQCHTKMRLTFSDSARNRDVSRAFREFYKETQSQIENGNLDSATASIQEMVRRGEWNLYEYALLWFLKSMVAQNRGNESAQLTALYQAMGKSGDFIDKDLYKALLPVMLALELNSSKYSAAIGTYNLMKKYPKLLTENEQLVAALNSRIEDNIIVTVPAQIEDCSDCSGKWGHRPLRQEFAFSNVNGELNEFELRCDWKRFRDAANTELVWKIPKSWGKCHLYVFGKVGTTFQFIEYPEQVGSQSSNHFVPNMFHALNTVRH